MATTITASAAAAAGAVRRRCRCRRLGAPASASALRCPWLCLQLRLYLWSAFVLMLHAACHGASVSERVLRRAERGRTACTGRRVGTCVTRLAPTQPAVSMLLCVSMLLPAMLYAMQTRALVRSGMSRLVHAYACTRA